VAETKIFRASQPVDTQTSLLGPLANLPGEWQGSGFNLISLPDKHDNQPFRVKLNATQEVLNFGEIGGQIPNRGSIQDDIEFLGILYEQSIVDATAYSALHVERGIWLNVVDSVNGNSVVRMSVIPHGDALLALGTMENRNGLPNFMVADSHPFTLDANGKRVNDTNPVYLQPFTDAVIPTGIPPSAVQNPNLVLLEAIQGQNIIETTVINVAANPIGDISASPTPIPANLGGILNIPFVVNNANATSFAATFWVETIQHADGSQTLQIQYSQTVILDFIGIKWPHISVATLVKR
jgi:hypothetical protein